MSSSSTSSSRAWSTGAIYSIMASGLVLTYSTSGIFNFAHGAVAFATAYLYYQLNTGLGVPIVPVADHLRCSSSHPCSVCCSTGSCSGGSRTAPVYARIVGTIGLLVALPGLVQWLVVPSGNDVLGPRLQRQRSDHQRRARARASVRHPHDTVQAVTGVVLNSDQIAVFIVAALAAVVLWFVIRRTRVGLEMRAVVDRESLAGLRGVNAARTSAFAWMLTMVLAGSAAS